MSLYTITIVPNNSPANTSLAYKDKEAAKAALRSINEQWKLTPDGSIVLQEDDYGRQVQIPAASISYLIFIDAQQDAELTVQRSLAQARMQKTAQNRAGSDPILTMQPINLSGSH